MKQKNAISVYRKWKKLENMYDKQQKNLTKQYNQKLLQLDKKYTNAENHRIMAEMRTNCKCRACVEGRIQLRNGW